jgi:hypothetical protein
MSNLDQLAAEINARLDRPSPDHRLAAGLLLRQAKAALPRGEWGAWTAANIKRSRGEVVRLLALAPAATLPVVIPQKRVAEATIKAATMVQEATIKAVTITATAKIKADRIIMQARIKAGEIKQAGFNEAAALKGITKDTQGLKQDEVLRLVSGMPGISMQQLVEAVHRGGGSLCIEKPADQVSP